MIDRDGFCPKCGVWWARRRNGRSIYHQCPKCFRALEDRPRPEPAEELRPGVRAEWSDERV